MKNILLLAASTQAITLQGINDFIVGGENFKTFMDPHSVNTANLAVIAEAKKQQEIAKNPDMVFGDSSMRMYNIRDESEPSDEIKLQFAGHAELNDEENDKIMRPISEAMAENPYKEQMTFSQMLNSAEEEVSADGALGADKVYAQPFVDTYKHGVHVKKETFREHVNNFLEDGGFEKTH